MNKQILILLALLLVLLTGCRAAGTGTMSQPETTAPQVTDTTTAPTAPTEPTGPNRQYLVEQLTIYRQIAMRLDEYDSAEGEESFRVRVYENGDYTTYDGYAGFAYCYRKLVEMEWLDPWLNEEGWAEYSVDMYEQTAPNFDRAAYLAGFTVLEDVLQRVDFVQYYTDEKKGTYSIDGYAVWYYNKDGRAYFVDNGPWRLPEYYTYNHITSADLLLRYDESGRLCNAYFGERNDYRSTMTPVYDDQGRLVTEFWEGPLNYRIDYTYNTSGLLVKKVMYERYGDDLSDGYSWVTTYTYDAEGKLLVEEEQGIFFDSVANQKNVWRIQTMEYAYDNSGVLVSMAQKTSAWHPNDMQEKPNSIGKTNFTYTFDAKGRLLTRTTYVSPTLFAGGTYSEQDVSHTVETYVYGNLYIYKDYEFTS